MHKQPKLTGTRFRIGLLTLCSFLLTAGISSGQETASKRDLREKLQQEVQANLARQKEHLPGAARTQLKELYDRDPSKLYAFLPPQKNSDPDSLWDPELTQVFGKHADRLFELAKAQAANGQEGEAYLTLFETLGFYSGHEGAIRILGPTAAELLAFESEEPNVTIMRQAERTFGWPAGKWVKVESPHYAILSDAGAEDLKPIIRKLERLYAVWDQVFFEYWSPPGRLHEALTDRSPLTRPKSRKHSVVVFASQQDYAVRLAGMAPNIEQSKGYYALKRRQSLFFLGDPTAESSWLHEASHQLFQERLSSRQSVGDRSNFWLVEGIAMFMESFEDFGSYVTLGGMFTERLQYARFNLFSRKFLRPVEELAAMGQSDFQNDAQVRQLYSQSAGVAQWLMIYEDGRHRQELMSLLKSVYRAKARPDSLLELIGETADEANREYIEFLRPRKLALNRFPPQGKRSGLCLAYGDIDDESLIQLDELTELEWLDLSEAPISDKGLQSIQNLNMLRQLFLSGTAVTDQGVASISRLPNLQELDLSGTRISNEGLKHLLNLKSLTALSIADTRIDDDAIQTLNQMTHLQSLDISGTNLSARSKTELKTMIDNVKS